MSLAHTSFVNASSSLPFAPAILASAILVSAISTGCATNLGAANTEEPTDQVVAGALSNDGSVVRISRINVQDGYEYSSCSGTLIAPDVVVTARHCVSDFGPSSRGAFDEFTTAYPANSLYVRTACAGDFEKTGAPFQERVVQHVEVPGPDARYGDILQGRDLAVLVLKEPMEFSRTSCVRPAKVRIPSNLSFEGERMSVVGFGCTWSSSDDCGQEVRRSRGTVFAIDLSDRSVLTENVVEHGDSGGPLFSKAHAVVAVVSESPDEGEGPAFYTRLSAHPDVLMRALRRANRSPWHEWETTMPADWLR